MSSSSQKSATYYLVTALSIITIGFVMFTLFLQNGMTESDGGETGITGFGWLFLALGAIQLLLGGVLLVWALIQLQRKQAEQPSATPEHAAPAASTEDPSQHP